MSRDICHGFHLDKWHECFEYLFTDGQRDLIVLLRASCLKNHSIDHLFLERIYSGYRWHAAEKVGCDKASREWYIREPIENIAKIPAKPL